MMKMNVMHMFLSELCFRVESKVFPELVNNGGLCLFSRSSYKNSTKSMYTVGGLNCTGPRPVPGLVNNGFYTQADIARLVEFAKLRGISAFLSLAKPASLTDSNSLSLLLSQPPF